MAHLGLKWRTYLSEEDCAFLIQYVENVKHNIQNDQMVLLSGINESGSYSIKQDIKTYLGGDLCGHYHKIDEIISSETIKKLGFISNIDDICSHTLFAHTKKMNQSLINFIKYKQSFIAVTLDHKRVHPNVKAYCRVLSINDLKMVVEKLDS